MKEEPNKQKWRRLNGSFPELCLRLFFGSTGSEDINTRVLPSTAEQKTQSETDSSLLSRTVTGTTCKLLHGKAARRYSDVKLLRGPSPIASPVHHVAKFYGDLFRNAENDPHRCPRQLLTEAFGILFRAERVNLAIMLQPNLEMVMRYVCFIPGRRTAMGPRLGFW